VTSALRGARRGRSCGPIAGPGRWAATWALVAATAFAATAFAATASAVDAAPARVLPPSVGALVEAAIARAGPAWSLRDATIAAAEVRATLLLRAEGGGPALEVAMLLRDPQPSCATEQAGAWCVTLRPDVAVGSRRALLAALAADPATAIWRTVSPAAAGGRLARASASARLGHAAAASGGHAASGGADGEERGDPGRSPWPALLALVGLGALTVGLAWRWMATPAKARGPWG